MFSLIIVIISIALVIALALATIYYGGGAATRSNARALATQAVTQSTQLLGAADLFYTDKGYYPASVSELVAAGYLKSEPVFKSAQNTQELMQSAMAANSIMTWSIPVPGQPTFVLSGAVSSPVCQEINSIARGDNGILEKAYTSLKTQCYGNLESLTTIVSKVPQGITSVLPVDKVSQGPLPDSDGEGWTVKPGTKVQPSGGTTTPLPTAVGVIGLSQNPVSLPAVEAGNIGLSRTSVTVTNLGAEVHNFELASFVAPDMSQVVAASCQTPDGASDTVVTLPPGGTCTLDVQYLSSTVGTKTVPLSIAADSGDVLALTYVFDVTASKAKTENPAEAGGLALNYSLVTFPDTKVGKSYRAPSITITNKTGSSIAFSQAFVDEMNSYSMSGVYLMPMDYNCVNEDDFSFKTEVPANTTCVFSPQFSPAAVQPYSRTIEVSPGLSLTLTGKGLSPYNIPTPVTINVPEGQPGRVIWTNNNDMDLYVNSMYMVQLDENGQETQYYVPTPSSCEPISANGKCNIEIGAYRFTDAATTHKLYFVLDGEMFFSGVTLNEVQAPSQAGTLTKTSQHYEGGGIVTLTAAEGTFSAGETPLIVLDSENDDGAYTVSPFDITVVDSRTVKFLIPAIQDTFWSYNQPYVSGSARMQVYYSGDGGQNLLQAVDSVTYVVNPTLSLTNPVSVAGTYNLTFTHPALDAGTTVLREPYLGGGENIGTRIGTPYNTTYSNGSGSATFAFNYFDFQAQRSLCCTTNQVNLYLRTGAGEVFPISFPVSYPPFAITSVTPSQAYVGSSGVKVTLYGTGFKALPGNPFTVIPFTRVGTESCTSISPYYTPVVVSDTEMYITIDQYGASATSYCTGMRVSNSTSGQYVNKANAFKYLGNLSPNGQIPGGSGGVLNEMLQGNTYNMPVSSNNTLGPLYTAFPSCSNDSCLALAYADYYKSIGHSGAFCTVTKQTSVSPYSETYYLNCHE